MYCPSCGIQTSSDPKYCRSCGMDLQMISQAVGEHSGQIIEIGDARDKELQRWGKITSLIGISVLSLLGIGAFICLSISKVLGMSFDDFGFDYFAPIVFTIALCLMVIGAGLVSYPNIRKELRRPLGAKRVGSADTTGQLGVSDRAEGMTSITERTTNLLETEDTDVKGGAKNEQLV